MIRLLVLLLLPTALLAQSIELPKVSEFRPTHVQLKSEGREYTIREPGAAWIKVHLKDVSSPVKVCSPGNSECHKFTPGDWKKVTRHGDSIGMLSITGDTARVIFLGSGRATVTGWDVGYGEAQYAEMNPTPEVFCGANDLQWVKCAETEEPALYERRRPVARIYMTSKGSICTAERVDVGNKMMTNNHCANSQEIIAASEVWFFYEYPTCDGTGTIVPVKVPAATMLDTYQPLDYTLFTVQDHPVLEVAGHLGFDVSNVPIGTDIAIIGHAQSKPKRYIRKSDLNASGTCKVDAYYNGFAVDSDYSYHCDSEGGQSGAPVLDYSTGRMVAIHHFGNVTVNGKCGNSGVKMFHIWPRISRFFDGVPAGDNETPVEGPIVHAQVSCVDNVCQYDSAGTIGEVLYWWFGDGSTSEQPSGTYTYTVPGLYDVVLYAKRNGATDTDTVSVQINVPGYNAPPRANFEATIDGLSIHFRSTSYDPENDPLTYDWKVRDPLDGIWHSYTVAEFTHTYTAPGPDKYAHLRVFDDHGNSSSTYFQRYTLTAPPPDPCGNGVCDAGETHSSCPADCPPPPPDPVCGDGVCNGSETWQTCPADCEAPPPQPNPIVLTVTAKKQPGNTFPATFKWSGAVGTQIELRGPETVKTVNDGQETLQLHNRNRGTSWRACDAVQCSKPVVVNF